MTFLWHDWAGYIGVVLVLLAFLLLQAHKLHGNGLVYQLMNVLGAVGVALSLVFGISPMNWPAFLMQVAWIIIGIYGVVHSTRARREARELGRKVAP
ncbi:CBU_0592 family membrane protein [Dyella sp. 20L07]|uniref:CBU_0592 family membrane protein n=1 Tax=Dyella sp. 20L07 TaxID=3384240 RepID=UPI003D299568